MSEIKIILSLRDERLKDRITREIFCKEFFEDLSNKIVNHNKGITIEINPKNAVIHLLQEFAFHECLKNALDAGAEELTFSLSIFIENNAEKIQVTLSDNGMGTQTPFQPYLYHQAFLSKSEKTPGSDKLGGAGKGLAMSAQYITLCGIEGSFLTGQSIHYPVGFSVSISAENKPARVTYAEYIQNFDSIVGRAIPVARDDFFSPLRSPLQTLEQAEKKLLKVLFSPQVVSSSSTASSGSAFFASPCRRVVPNLSLQLPVDDSDDDNASVFS